MDLNEKSKNNIIDALKIILLFLILVCLVVKFSLIEQPQPVICKCVKEYHPNNKEKDPVYIFRDSKKGRYQVSTWAAGTSDNPVYGYVIVDTENGNIVKWFVSNKQ